MRRFFKGFVFSLSVGLGILLGVLIHGDFSNIFIKVGYSMGGYIIAFMLWAEDKNES